MVFEVTILASGTGIAIDQLTKYQLDRTYLFGLMVIVPLSCRTRTCINRDKNFFWAVDWWEGSLPERFKSQVKLWKHLRRKKMINKVNNYIICKN